MTENPDPAEGRITTELRDGLFLIGIDRPAKLNGFTPVMLRGMAQAYTRYEHEPAARCAVVFAEGAHFTAGLDLPKVAPYLGGDTLLVEAGEIDPFESRPPYRSKPVVFAVHGICFTLGIEMMLAADIVVAARDTRFSQLEVKRGLMPDFGGAFRISRVLPANVAREMTSWFRPPGSSRNACWVTAFVRTSTPGGFLANTSPTEERSFRATPSGV